MITAIVTVASRAQGCLTAEVTSFMGYMRSFNTRRWPCKVMHFGRKEYISSESSMTKRDFIQILSFCIEVCFFGRLQRPTY